MADLVNLRIVRKRAARQQQDRAAAESRIKHGRSSADRDLAEKHAAKERRNLDSHRIDGDDR